MLLFGPEHALLEHVSLLDSLDCLHASHLLPQALVLLSQFFNLFVRDSFPLSDKLKGIIELCDFTHFFIELHLGLSAPLFGLLNDLLLVQELQLESCDELVVVGRLWRNLVCFFFDNFAGTCSVLLFHDLGRSWAGHIRVPRVEPGASTIEL